MARRTDDDILNTDRIFYRMIREYADGTLSNKQHYYRARVEHSDPEGGKLEISPRNPQRSVRARVYSSGLDATTPREALTIFYPLNEGRCPQPGEHVLVSFENEDMTSGYWHSIVPAFHDDNYANPDFRESTRRDPSYIFEGDPQTTSTIPTDYEYGGSTIQTQGRQEVVDMAESETGTNPWLNKKVLAIGDSQMAGFFGSTLGDKLRGQHGVSQFIRDGRVGWGVYSWLSGQARQSEARQSLLSDLVAQHNPDIVVISLGGNDGSSGKARRADYLAKIRELLEQAGNAIVIWSGPPTAVGPAAANQSGRSIAGRKIQTILGDRFVNVESITNTLEGRRPDGVHFLRNSPALDPWAEAVIQTGYRLSR